MRVGLVVEEGCFGEEDDFRFRFFIAASCVHLEAHLFEGFVYDVCSVDCIFSGCEGEGAVVEI